MQQHGVTDFGFGTGFPPPLVRISGFRRVFHSPAVLAFDFARPDAAVEQPAEKAVEGLSVPQVGQIAVNDWRQYVRAVAINEKFVQYLLVVDAPQAAGYIPFGRYDECLVAAFAVGACPVFVRAVEVVVVVERLQHVEQFARKREPVQVS